MIKWDRWKMWGRKVNGKVKVNVNVNVNESKMKPKIKKYKDRETGKRIVEINDLSFLMDRNRRYNWFQRHFQNRRCKRACKKADEILALDNDLAFDLMRYYFIPKYKIKVKRDVSPRRMQGKND